MVEARLLSLEMQFVNPTRNSQSVMRQARGTKHIKGLHKNREPLLLSLLAIGCQ